MSDIEAERRRLAEDRERHEQTIQQATTSVREARERVAVLEAQLAETVAQREATDLIYVQTVEDLKEAVAGRERAEAERDRLDDAFGNWRDEAWAQTERARVAEEKLAEARAAIRSVAMDAWDSSRRAKAEAALKRLSGAAGPEKEKQDG